MRAKKNGEQAIGRSRGGPSTKIHALVDALGSPVELMLTPGQAHDLVCAEPLIENVRDCDFALYCERNLVERFFNKIKHFRAIATRYDKLARNFLAAVRLVSAIILLN